MSSIVEQNPSVHRDASPSILSSTLKSVPTAKPKPTNVSSTNQGNKTLMYCCVVSIVVLVVLVVVLGVLLHNKQRQIAFLEQRLYGQVLTPERRHEIYHEHIQLQRLQKEQEPAAVQTAATTTRPTTVQNHNRASEEASDIASQDDKSVDESETEIPQQSSLSAHVLTTQNVEPLPTIPNASPMQAMPSNRPLLLPNTPKSVAATNTLPLADQVVATPKSVAGTTINSSTPKSAVPPPPTPAKKSNINVLPNTPSRRDKQQELDDIKHSRADHLERLARSSKPQLQQQQQQALRPAGAQQDQHSSKPAAVQQPQTPIPTTLSAAFGPEDTSQMTMIVTREMFPMEMFQPFFVETSSPTIEAAVQRNETNNESLEALDHNASIKSDSEDSESDHDESKNNVENKIDQLTELLETVNDEDQKETGNVVEHAVSN